MTVADDSVWHLDRRGVVYVGRDTMQQFLDLPGDWQVLAVIPVSDPVGMRLVVEGKDLPPVPPNAQYPPLPGAWTRQVVMHDGKAYSRWEFKHEPDRPPGRWVWVEEREGTDAETAG